MNFAEAYEYGSKLVLTDDFLSESARYNEACLRALKMQIPQEVIFDCEERYRAYSPGRCPNCGYILSTFEGDGIYRHPEYLNMCHECGQKILWSGKRCTDNK